MNKTKKIVSISLSIIFYLTALFLIFIIIKNDLSYISTSRGVKFVLLILSSAAIYAGTFFLCLTQNKKTKNKIKKFMIWLFFVQYLYLLITLGFFDKRSAGNIFLLNSGELRAYITKRVNLTPFKEIIKYLTSFSHPGKSFYMFWGYFVGNIITFTPFALFLPRLLKVNTFLKFFIIMVLIVVCVEAIQFITMSGYADVDDVILNVSGSAAAYWVLNKTRLKNYINKFF